MTFTDAELMMLYDALTDHIGDDEEVTLKGDYGTCKATELRAKVKAEGLRRLEA